MIWIFAIASGALLGLTNLPESFWWFGLAWGVLFVMMLYRSPKLSHLFVFAYVKQFVAYLWVLGSLLKHDPSLGSWMEYIFSTFFVALPLWFGIALVILIVGWIKADSSRKLFYRIVALPLGYYLGHLWGYMTPFGEVPGGEMGHQSLFTATFSGAYPIIGSLGVETLWVMLILFLPLMFMLKDQLQKLILLPLLPLCLLATLHWIGDFQKKEGEFIEVLLLPWSGSIGTTPQTGQVVADLKKRIALVNDDQIDLILLPEGALPGTLEQEKAIKSLQSELFPSQKLLLGTMQKDLIGDRYYFYNVATLFSSGLGQPVISQKEQVVPFVEELPAWAELLGLHLVLKRNFELEEGVNQSMVLQNQSFIAGICFEQYFDSFYRSKEDNARFYLFLNKEIDLPYYAKSLLYQVADAKAMQTYKTVLRATSGGLSGVSAAEIKKESTGLWIPKAIAGRYQIRPETKESLFYRWAFLTLLFFFGITWVALSIAYTPYYKRG